jgi:hypothetical protein
MGERIDLKKLAQIEYHGQAGFASECVNAIVRLIHFGDIIEKAMLISHIGKDSGTHCFILTVNSANLIAIKSGFSSGYHGEGPRGLSNALHLLLRHGTKIDEYMVEKELIERLDSSCLLNSDIYALENARPVTPVKFYDYIRDLVFDNDKYLRPLFPYTVPLRLIDLRLFDLALALEGDQDALLFTGYRRLEDIIRERIGLDELSGVKLLSQAFQGDGSILHWPGIVPAENKGRGLLFTGAFMAYRNRRGHRELKNEHEEIYREFLLLNELFLLESSAVLRSEK